MIRDPDKCHWHRLKMLGHPDSYVLAHRDHRRWIALLYFRGDSEARMRVFHHGEWEEKSSLDLPPSVGGGAVWFYRCEHEGARRVLVWLQGLLDLPERFTDLYDIIGEFEPLTLPALPPNMIQEGSRVLFSRLRDMLPPFMVRPFCNSVRWRRYRDGLQPRKTCWEAYPEDADALREAIQAEVTRRDADYDDSYRAALVGDRAGMRRFHRVRSCCGSREWEEVVNGRRYRLGYNYGH